MTILMAVTNQWSLQFDRPFLPDPSYMQWSKALTLTAGALLSVIPFLILYRWTPARRTVFNLCGGILAGTLVVSLVCGPLVFAADPLVDLIARMGEGIALFAFLNVLGGIVAGPVVLALVLVASIGLSSAFDIVCLWPAVGIDDRTMNLAGFIALVVALAYLRLWAMEGGDSPLCCQNAALPSALREHWIPLFAGMVPFLLGFAVVGLLNHTTGRGDGSLEGFTSVRWVLSLLACLVVAIYLVRKRLTVTMASYVRMVVLAFVTVSVGCVSRMPFVPYSELLSCVPLAVLTPLLLVPFCGYLSVWIWKLGFTLDSSYMVISAVYYAALCLGNVLGAFLSARGLSDSVTPLVLMAFLMMGALSVALLERTAWGLASSATDGCDSAENEEGNDAAVKWLSEQCGLTAREREVALLLAGGRSYQYCADVLGISINTVRMHVKRLYAKAAVNSKAELLDVLEAGMSMGVRIKEAGVEPQG